MKRRVLAVCAILSLLASVAAAVLGVRSFYEKDKLEYVSQSGRLVLLISARGRLDVLYHPRWAGDPGFLHIRGSPSGMGATEYSNRVFGFGSGGRPDGMRFVNIPYWFLALAFVVPGALAVSRLWRLRTLLPGLCKVCGYDLRASEGRCPECGTTVGVARIGQRGALRRGVAPGGGGGEAADGLQKLGQ